MNTNNRNHGKLVSSLLVVVSLAFCASVSAFGDDDRAPKLDEVKTSDTNKIEIAKNDTSATSVVVVEENPEPKPVFHHTGMMENRF